MHDKSNHLCRAIMSLNGAQVNVVAFVIDHTVEVGAIRLPSDQPLVASVPKEQLLKEYEGWGSDVTAVLSCIQNPNKWYVNIVHPPLARYAKGKVALVGDAVRDFAWRKRV